MEALQMLKKIVTQIIREEDYSIKIYQGRVKVIHSDNINVVTDHPELIEAIKAFGLEFQDSPNPIYTHIIGDEFKESLIKSFNLAADRIHAGRICTPTTLTDTLCGYVDPKGYSINIIPVDGDNIVSVICGPGRMEEMLNDINLDLHLKFYVLKLEIQEISNYTHELSQDVKTQIIDKIVTDITSITGGVHI